LYSYCAWTGIELSDHSADKKKVTIVDYGMGNLGSIQNMLKKIGIVSVISSQPSEIEKAEMLVLPGVGSFDSGMRKLADMGLMPVLTEKVIEQHTPVLGVCLGMQLMTCGSEEGNLRGLGWIEGETIHFRLGAQNEKLKIPHMGWNTVDIQKPGNLFREITGEVRFYFVHSYHVVCREVSDITAITEYGYPFVSAIQKGNVMGVQFHPEKSHRFGMALLRNFCGVT
jgi:glutamine amidotransferase